MYIAYNKRNGEQEFIRLDYEQVRILVTSQDDVTTLYDGYSMQAAHRAFDQARRHGQPARIILEVK